MAYKIRSIECICIYVYVYTVYTYIPCSSVASNNQKTAMYLKFKVICVNAQIQGHLSEWVVFCRKVCRKVCRKGQVAAIPALTVHFTWYFDVQPNITQLSHHESLCTYASSLGYAMNELCWWIILVCLNPQMSWIHCDVIELSTMWHTRMKRAIALHGMPRNGLEGRNPVCLVVLLRSH